MKLLASFVLVVAAGVLIAADASDDAVKKEREALKGTWKITSFAADGTKPPTDEQLEKITTTINDKGEFKVEFDNKGVIEIVVTAETTIDPSKSPKTIDFKFTEGPPKGKSALGIYELKDDTLKYCRAAPGQARPTEFSAKEGTKQTLVQYKRAKAK
jgi:uncharacterized protein (TIGR03067 family)